MTSNLSQVLVTSKLYPVLVILVRPKWPQCHSNELELPQEIRMGYRKSEYPCWIFCLGSNQRCSAVKIVASFLIVGWNAYPYGRRGEKFQLVVER